MRKNALRFLLLREERSVYCSGVKCRTTARWYRCYMGRWKTRGRDPGVQGTGSRDVENAGCGNLGVWWKTQGLVEMTESGGKTRGLSGKQGLSENMGSECKTRVISEKKNMGKLFFFLPNMNFPH